MVVTCRVLNSLLVAVALLLVANAPEARAADAVAVGWDSAPDILAAIEEPTFPDNDFVITDDAYEGGAEPGGETDCLPAIKAAIKACNAAGGGRVVIPAGEWFVKGPIHLLSNVNLHAEAGAKVQFSNEPNDFLPPVLTRFEGTEVYTYSPPLYALDQENIAITGGGVFDGGADDDHWWTWKRERGDINKLREQAESNVAPEKRVFGEGNTLRVNFVQPYRCHKVLLEGYTLNRSPMWCQNPVLCTSVTVRGVTVESHGPNNDGCNPEACDGVLIEDCVFDTGDDCIAIKSGRNADGRRIGTPSKNIVVRNCTMRDGHGGVVLGSEMSGGIENVFVEDCYMSSPNLERAIRLKSNSMRGGYLRNMHVRNVEVGEVSDAVFRINLVYDQPETGPHVPHVSNVTLENVTSKKSKRALHLVGLPDAPITGLTLRNCTFAGAKQPSLIEHVEDLSLENFSMPK
ncbi:Polygalacturonase [Pseudobythopirellula maris]|uniref:Polygalacturonase n=1 Tax=Pseudobythopirellula maris TaxID=2527991 RepID=A0A5C5ZJZ6_9BACT|nr:glycoside hydrolase family 28 protein [Pseudobythopirellula maris]TWT87367.1 Polygalacturonase [Pseudobythopirellula maris]